MNENRIDLVKWLRVLIYIAIARIINTLVGIPAFIPTALTAWISRILMALMVFAMFKLAPANDQYNCQLNTRLLVPIICRSQFEHGKNYACHKDSADPCSKSCRNKCRNAHNCIYYASYRNVNQYTKPFRKVNSILVHSTSPFQ